jgi:hypothetical protein
VEWAPGRLPPDQSWDCFNGNDGLDWLAARFVFNKSVGTMTTSNVSSNMLGWVCIVTGIAGLLGWVCIVTGIAGLLGLIFIILFFTFGHLSAHSTISVSVSQRP